MGNYREQERLREMLAWYEDNVVELRALIAKYDKAEQDLREREQFGWHIHIGEVS